MDPIARPADQSRRRALKTFRLHEKETVRKIARKPRPSVLGVILGFFRFAIAMGMIATVIGLAVLAFAPAPRVTVTVPVSFRLDNASPRASSARRPVARGDPWIQNCSFNKY